MVRRNIYQIAMEYFDKEFCLEVWGPMACFTRPELKVERVSYDVITPSAARAIFEAIFWKPAIHWQVTKIEVLNEIQWMSVRRNEVGAVAGKTPIFIEDKRQQKNTLMLRDVRYRIWAKLCFIPIRERIKGNKSKYQRWFDEKNDKYDVSKNPLIDAMENDLLRKDENPGKYNAMFERRAKNGQCFNQPYLGTRECVASFKYIDSSEIPLKTDECYYYDKGEIRLGMMFYDWDFSNIYDTQKKFVDYRNASPLFFRAVMNNGIITVPPINSQEILR